MRYHFIKQVLSSLFYAGVIHHLIGETYWNHQLYKVFIEYYLPFITHVSLGLTRKIVVSHLFGWLLTTRFSCRPNEMGH